MSMTYRRNSNGPWTEPWGTPQVMNDLLDDLFPTKGSQAGVVDINHAFHFYYKCCMWIEFRSISTWLRGFSPGTPVSSLIKIDSQSNPSGCGAVLRSHIWIVFRGWAPNRQHSSFGPTSLSCALGNSVYGLRERVISRSSSLLQNACHKMLWNSKIKLWRNNTHIFCSKKSKF